MKQPIKIVTNNEGERFAWLVVTNQAIKVFNAGVFQLFILYDDGTESAIDTAEELNNALESSLEIGVEVGHIDDSVLLRQINSNKDIFVQNQTLAEDRISDLEEGLRNAKGAMLDKSSEKMSFAEDSPIILGINNLLGKKLEKPTKRYRLIICPSSDEDKRFENLTYEEADTYNDDKEGSEKLLSMAHHSFNSNKDRELFLQGYHAAIGYLGDGAFKTKDDEKH